LPAIADAPSSVEHRIHFDAVVDLPITAYALNDTLSAILTAKTDPLK
jgi:hypothetical protein